MKESRLVQEIRRILKATELRTLIEGASLDDLLAVERLLDRRRSVGKAGARELYSDALRDVVVRDVRQEMKRLEDAGEKRHGARTAIRRIVVQAVTTTKGTASVVGNPQLIDKLVAEHFKIWEAARKRG